MGQRTKCNKWEQEPHSQQKDGHPLPTGESPHLHRLMLTAIPGQCSKKTLVVEGYVVLHVFTTRLFYIDIGIINLIDPNPMCFFLCQIDQPAKCYFRLFL